MSRIDPDALKAAARVEPGRPVDTARFERANLAEIAVLGIDPTLGATGWALVEHTEYELAVRAYETIKYSGVKTTDEQAAAGDMLFLALRSAMRRCLGICPGGFLVAIEEWPNAQGSRLSNPTSSIQAGRVARCAAQAEGIGLAPMVHPQHHHHVLTGNRGASKAELKLHLGLLAQSLPIRGYVEANENVRDGVSVALTTMHDRRG